MVKRKREKAQAAEHGAEAAEPEESSGVNINFGRRLAHSSDKKVRDKAVKVLTRWLSGQRSLTELDMKKLWKGLYYCMWMSDKPLIQLELAQRLSGLIHVLPTTKMSSLFIKVFFTTIMREWDTIDRLRLDKFYSLIRHFVRQSFAFLEKHKFDSKLVEEWTSMLSEHPLNPNQNLQLHVPQGIRFHLTDIYLTELSHVLNETGNESLDNDPSLLDSLLAPFYALITQSGDLILMKRIRDNVFDTLVNQAQMQLGDDDEDDEEETEWPLCFRVNAELLEKKIFELASSTGTLDVHRDNLYSIKQSFSRLKERGDVEDFPPPLELPTPVASPKKKVYKTEGLASDSEEEDDDDDDEDMEEEEDDEEEDDEEDDEEEEEEKPKTRAKRQKSSPKAESKAKAKSKPAPSTKKGPSPRKTRSQTKAAAPGTRRTKK